MLPINPRELQKQLKQLKRLGMKIEQIEDVENVYIELTRKRISIKNPEVFVIELSGQKMFYILSQNVHEEPKVITSTEKQETQQVLISISDEDVRFVAEYTGASLEKAREAIVKAGGDLAKAIELIENEKKALTQ